MSSDVVSYMLESAEMAAAMVDFWSGPGTSEASERLDGLLMACELAKATGATKRALDRVLNWASRTRESVRHLGPHVDPTERNEVLELLNDVSGGASELL